MKRQPPLNGLGDLGWMLACAGILLMAFIVFGLGDDYDGPSGENDPPTPPAPSPKVEPEVQQVLDRGDEHHPEPVSVGE